MVTDPISDLLVRLRNGFRRHHDVVTIPASKLKHEVLRVLQAEGFIQGIDTATEDGHPVLKVQLRYVGEGEPMITGMQRVSKPGRRVYVGTREIPRVRNVGSSDGGRSRSRTEQIRSTTSRFVRSFRLPML